jgi:hypothetical protein
VAVVSTDRFLIVEPFPQPPGSVVRAWELLQVLRRQDPDEMAEAGVDNSTHLPRPWLPSGCDDELREGVWMWCDAAAAWLNREYTWRPQQMIPPCWPQHPHIANELPVLVFLRWLAEDSLGPEALEEWHRYTVPMFLDRMTNRLGESTCRTGRHQDWPAESRYHNYFADELMNDRADRIHLDTHPVIELHGQRA